MEKNYFIAEEYSSPETVEIATKLLEYYLTNKDSHNEGFITYGDLCKRLSFEMHPRVIERYLGEISFACKENGLPPISAIVVNKTDTMPGAGFFDAYCSKKNEIDRIEEWNNIITEIHKCEEWNSLLDAYKKLY